MSEEILIRPVRPDDLPQWRPLWDGYNAFYRRADATALPDATTATTWSRFFDSYEPVHALAAERAGRLIGPAHFIFHRSTTSIAPTCYLQDPFTLESERGKGAGRALIEQVYREAQTAGCSRVYWQTHETNSNAMVLYDKVAEKSGFIVYRKPLLRGRIADKRRSEAWCLAPSLNSSFSQRL